MSSASADKVAIVSYRLGGTDGVSIEAAKWGWALHELGYEVTTVAGDGVADHVLAGLSMDPGDPEDDEQDLARDLEVALSGADLVVVENLCSLPLNPAAGRAVARALRGRRAVLRHHDLAWQRPGLADTAPPTDPAWRHVCINERSRRELAARGITSTTFYNRFDIDPPTGDRQGSRDALGVTEAEVLMVQPTRAIRRKNVAGALRLAAELGATYWLLGGPEDGYEPELERLLAAARCRVVRVSPDTRPTAVADAYAACDLVVLPSTWEGFGNPSVESATYRRPLAIGPYPVATEIRSFGFRWFDLGDPVPLARWLSNHDPELVEHNVGIARESFAITDLPGQLGEWLAKQW